MVYFHQNSHGLKSIALQEVFYISGSEMLLSLKIFTLGCLYSLFFPWGLHCQLYISRYKKLGNKILKGSLTWETGANTVNSMVTQQGHL